MIAIWVLSGLIGSMWAWYWAKSEEKAPINWCPSPIEIVAVVLGSALGPVMLAAVAIARTIVWLTKPQNDWFWQPICKTKK